MSDGNGWRMDVINRCLEFGAGGQAGVITLLLTVV